jgi:hypothetical protein
MTEAAPDEQGRKPGRRFRAVGASVPDPFAPATPAAADAGVAGLPDKDKEKDIITYKGINIPITVKVKE